MLSKQYGEQIHQQCRKFIPEAPARTLAEFSGSVSTTRPSPPNTIPDT